MAMDNLHIHEYIFVSYDMLNSDVMPLYFARYTVSELLQKNTIANLKYMAEIADKTGQGQQ